MVSYFLIVNSTIDEIVLAVRAKIGHKQHDRLLKSAARDRLGSGPQWQLVVDLLPRALYFLPSLS